MITFTMTTFSNPPFLGSINTVSNNDMSFFPILKSTLLSFDICSIQVIFTYHWSFFMYHLVEPLPTRLVFRHFNTECICANQKGLPSRCHRGSTPNNKKVTLSFRFDSCILLCVSVNGVGTGSGLVGSVGTESGRVVGVGTGH